MTLREVLDDAAAAVTHEALTNVTDGDGGITWAVGTVIFATLDGEGAVAAFRLDRVLADAARRTPDTGASDRGPDWVTFVPATLDGPAIDRAVAWFGAAARRAAD